MHIPSLPPTRSSSPNPLTGAMPRVTEEQVKEEGDLAARKIGLGHLMKSAQQDVQVPEFDMNSFF